MAVEGVPSRSFTLKRSTLTEIERICYECLKQIASEGRVVSQYEIAAAVGTDNVNGGTMAGIVNRLVEKGFVEHVAGRLQKGIWVRIVATGETTAEPQCKSVHWRYRKDRVPAPTIQRVSEYAKPLAQLVEAKARSLGKPLSEFLMDCVYVGFHEICRDAE